MSTNQLNVLVNLMIAIAFFVSESRDAQTNGYLNQEPAILPQKYCGEMLLNILRIVCNGTYNSMYDNSTDQEKTMANYQFDSDSSPSPVTAQETSNGTFDDRNNRRKPEDIYEECCRNSCTLSDLSMYCA
ncbi:LIRP-like [Camponotus floridanus]|uniref:LIRP-like n=1 Tax=Camponotus floridanus TaxID=104421 RepID=UPI000DC6C80C|nr:LIRP-like [Camponotus floridanus]